MRITVVGPSGSGKTALTNKISKKFNLPKLEIDRLWFESGGHNCFINGGNEEEKNIVSKRIEDKVIEFLLLNESWVIDGTYTRVQSKIAEKADNVILVRRSVLKRIFSHILRVVKRKDRHPETTMWQDLCFTKIIIKRWLNGENKKLDIFLANYKNKLIVLKSFKEIDDYFYSLEQDNLNTIHHK